MAGFLSGIAVPLGVAALLVAAAPASALEWPGPLVDPDWLARHLHRPKLVVLDIRNPIGGADRNTYELGHVPGSIYSNFVTDPWHDMRTPVPLTLAPTPQLELQLGRLGIGNDDFVVVVHGGVDSSDYSTGARMYWTFRLLGHDAVTILDGGFRAWEAAGLPVEQGWNERPRTRFTAAVRQHMIATTAEVQQALERGAQLVDARAPEYFLGRERPPMTERAGTLPGAINLDHRQLVDAGTGRLLDRPALGELLRELGIERDRETITFCNIGHWSALAWFVLHELAGFEDVSLYDGSMVEWAASPARPVVHGTARTGR